ncbi:MAG: hypothetical protein OEM23_00720 [Gemmatimonadota bacterium]|nr:hypothetical protein [Gemmatimonadota bacterium]MDH3426931.1 hypothetical protein [Gemmatimonadota bacterium]
MRTVKLGMMLATTAGLSGCLFAAAAGAGGAIALTGHTAEAIVARPVSDMADAAERVLGEEQVAITASRTEDSGATRVFEGRKGDLDVTVTIEGNENGTRLRVSAQRSVASWDDDYAKELLAKIIA